MKNRKLVILLIAVAGIWGTIGFKIYQSLTDDPDVFHAPTRRAMSDSSRQEVYVLSLHYQDPFLKKNKLLQSKPLKRKIIQESRSTVSAPQVMIDWSKVEYFGLMHNSSRKITSATIKISGNEYFVKEGGSIEGFIVSEIRNDSVKLSFQNQSKYVRRAKQ